jgi:predicted TIM-barrel fold metal-dependent hydrolase
MAAWESELAIDHHCHPLRPWVARLDPADLRACFSEALDPGVVRDHVPNTAAYRQALRRLAAALGCSPTEEAVLDSRSGLTMSDLMERTLTGLMLVDRGFGGREVGDVRIPQRDVLRLETLAEDLVGACADVEAWLASVRTAVRETSAVAVKTIAAYRASLRLRAPSEPDLVAAYTTLRAEPRPRVRGDPLCHALVFEAARECARLELPLQVHCGFGDPDEDLAEASPLGLRPLFTDPTFDGLRVVMLHCYPFHREAAYLCSVHPNAWMDLSLTVPLAGVDARRAMAETLGLCPWSKLLYATDASRQPEMYVVAASLYREALATAFGELVEEGVLGFDEAEEAGRRVLSANARELYRLA